MLRSAWLMQEVLQTFNGTLAEVRRTSSRPFLPQPTRRFLPLETDSCLNGGPNRRKRSAVIYSPQASLLPNSEVGGIFRVTLYNDGDALLLWDRKEEGRFPEVQSRERRETRERERERERERGRERE